MALCRTDRTAWAICGVWGSSRACIWIHAPRRTIIIHASIRAPQELPLEVRQLICAIDLPDNVGKRASAVVASPVAQDPSAGADRLQIFAGIGQNSADRIIRTHGD